MTPPNVVRLDSYRGRRDARLRRTLALHGQSAWRTHVFRCLARAVTLAEGDRGAIFWLDEYGPGLAHPFMLLDLVSDRPRRSSPLKILRDTWERGVPGLLDITDIGSRQGRELDGARSLCAVALGSDGFRSWFLVVDSLTPRPVLGAVDAGELMFVAGELASVVLHRSVNEETGFRAGVSEVPAVGEEARPGFAGWPVLQDIEDRQDDEEASRRITARFLVARFIRGLLDDQLVGDPESVTYQIRGIRRELSGLPTSEPEKPAWERVLAAVEANSHDELLSAMLVWGPIVERQGHLHGALEIHGMAYEMAVSMGSLDGAVDAARFRGRVLRMQAEWDRAEAWYCTARRLAEEAGDSRKLAAVMDGLANTYRDRGNLRRAKGILLEVMAIGQAAGERYAEAIAHHDLMTVEKLMGSLSEAVRHGWLAVQAYESPEGRVRALFDLAGVLRESGELGAARDAYALVASQVETFEYRILSLDALAYISALMGEEEEHERLRTRMEAEGWQRSSPVYRAQILFYRGLSERALGREPEGREWLEKALTFAEDHGLSKLIFDVEKAIAEGPVPLKRASHSDPEEGPECESILGVRQGLRALREAQVEAV